MAKFYNYEIENLYNLYNKDVEDIDVAADILEKAGLNLAKDLNYYLKYENDFLEFS